MNGHRSIIQARREGLKPQIIFFEVDLPQIPLEKRFWFEDPENALQSKQHARVEMSLAEPWRWEDFRFVVGCTVCLQANAWSDDLIDLAERIADSGAAHLVVGCPGQQALLQYSDSKWVADA